MPPGLSVVIPGVAWGGELYYDDTPPSLNKVGSRGNAKGAHWDFTNAKQLWQGIVEQLLLQARAPTHRVSGLQDVERGRPLEVDETFGDLVSKAASLGVPVPTIDVAYRLIRGIDRGLR